MNWGGGDKRRVEKRDVAPWGAGVGMSRWGLYSMGEEKRQSRQVWGQKYRKSKREQLKDTKHSVKEDHGG